MKEVKLFFVMAFMLIASSCNGRVSLDIEREDDNTSDELNEVEVTIIGSFANAMTRAYPSTPDEMRKARVNFNGIRLLFYELDKEGKPGIVAYEYDKDINAENGVMSGADYMIEDGSEDNFMIRGPIKVKKGNYHVYMIAGPTNAIKEVTSVGKDFKLIQSAISRDEDTFLMDGYLKNSIFINHEPVVITDDVFNGSKNNEAGGAGFTLPVCEVAPVNAFASVSWEPVIKDSKYIISNKRILIYVDVQNKKFILLPSFDEKVKGALKVNYPIDANYSGMRAKPIDELGNDFLYLPTTGIDESKKRSVFFSSERGGRRDKYIVIPENTMDATEYYGTVVTRLIIMANIYPKEMDLGGVDINTIADRASLPSWVYFKGKGYTEKEFDELYRMSSEGSTESDHSDIIAAYQELKKGGDRYPDTGYQSSTIRYYKNGTSYFSIPIQHFRMEELNGDPTLPGLYGVVRNTHYDINIKSFQSVGAAHPTALTREISYGDNVNVPFVGVHIQDANVIKQDIDILY